MHGGLHHLHARQRTYKHLSPYPHPNRVLRAFDHFMYAVSVITPLALLPQVYTLYTTHDASGLSFSSWVIVASIKVFWIIYSFAHRTWPIAISSVLFLLIDIAVIVGIYLFR